MKFRTGARCAVAVAGVVFKFDDVVVGGGLLVPNKVFTETDGSAWDVFGVELLYPLGCGLGVEDVLERLDHVLGEFVGFGRVVVEVRISDARVFQVEVIQQACARSPIESA